MKDADLNELTGNQIKTTLNCFVNDEDVKRQMFKHKKNLSNNSPINIRIKQHKQSNEECPCIENGDNVRLFNKRSRSNSLTSARPKAPKMRGEGRLPTGDGPALNVACLELNSIETYDPESLGYYKSD